MASPSAFAIHEHANRRRTAQFVELKPGDIDETLASILAGIGNVSEPANVTKYLTMFVNDVHRLSPAAQQTLMYFLDGTSPASSISECAEAPTVRLVTATSDDLARRVSAGLFSMQLFYRLNVILIAMPPHWDTDDRDAQALLASISHPVSEIEIR